MTKTPILKQSLFRFYELEKEASEIALEEVYKIEILETQDYSHDNESLQDYLVELIREAGLSVESRNVYWKNDECISLDLSEVEMTEAYIEKSLSKKDFLTYKELLDLSNHHMESSLFDEFDDGFQLHYNNPFPLVEEKPAMDFIMKFSTDEDMKAKYKLAIIFCNEDGELESNEGIKDLKKDLETITGQVAQNLSTLISEPLKILYYQIEDLVAKHEDYIGSKEYFYNLLNDESYLSEQYLFNKDGSIIQIDNAFLNPDDEELYKAYES